MKYLSLDGLQYFWQKVKSTFYSATNQPPYPVTSVNGQTGDVTVAAGGAVTSVNNKTGAVTLTKSDVGLGSVDNTADSSKSVYDSARLGGKLPSAFVQQTRATLYNNSTGSATSVSLSSSAANYTYFKIFYRNNDNGYNSLEVYSPNGKSISLTAPVPVTGNAIYFKTSTWVISGISITKSLTLEKLLDSGSSVGSTAAGNFIYITRVEGYN